MVRSAPALALTPPPLQRSASKIFAAPPNDADEPTLLFELHNLPISHHESQIELPHQVDSLMPLTHHSQHSYPAQSTSYLSFLDDPVLDSSYFSSHDAFPHSSPCLASSSSSCGVAAPCSCDECQFRAGYFSTPHLQKCLSWRSESDQLVSPLPPPSIDDFSASSSSPYSYSSYESKSSYDCCDELKADDESASHIGKLAKYLPEDEQMPALTSVRARKRRVRDIEDDDDDDEELEVDDHEADEQVDQQVEDDEQQLQGEEEEEQLEQEDEEEDDDDEEEDVPPPSSKPSLVRVSTPPRSLHVSIPAAGTDDDAATASASPPHHTVSLPVKPSELLPGRPNTGVIPASHVKDRLVKSARKLLTAADGDNENVQVQVIPIYYPSKQAANHHKIRLIRVENLVNSSVAIYAHAADVGGVVERKSNISRLFGKFESPSEKLLMNVVGAHNHTVGQESNILTCKGIRRFLQTNKMKDEHAYRAWIIRQLIPRLQLDPLEVGDEDVEIEASTDPNCPHTVRPSKKINKKFINKHVYHHQSRNTNNHTNNNNNKRQKTSPTPSSMPLSTGRAA